MTNPQGKPLLVCTRPGREWTLAHLQGDPPRAVLHSDQRFASLEAAEWAVFKQRWKALTGREPELE